MNRIIDNYCELPTMIRRPMWRIWHSLLNRFDRDHTVNFMNYGFVGLNGEKRLDLEEADERNRYCIQLYDHVVNKIKIRNRRILEIGSGRGGGAHYITRYYKPKQYTGVDISAGVINFRNRFYNVPGLSFVEGRAEKIPLEAESYDVAVNVESARCYGNMRSFFKEVHRVLHPDGHFVFADIVEKGTIPAIRHMLQRSGFNIETENEITENVAKGLEMDSERREWLIQRKIPGILKQPFKSFAGTKGTHRFESLRNGKFEYWSFVLTKKNTA